MNFLKERTIPYFYLYDTRGSELFNEITKLKEYYPFKKEEEILNQYVEKILEFPDDLHTDKITLVEFGAGYSEKTKIIINKLIQKYSNVEFIPIDVSESACFLTYETYKGLLEVNPFIGTYDMYLERKTTHPNRVIYLWLGSSIGNLRKDERTEFLKKLSALMTYRDLLLIGFDTIYKEKEIIKSAYDDEMGISAKFILNILSHLKNKFNLDIVEQDFDYFMEYNDIEERVEMYVRCIRDTIVTELENNYEKLQLKKDEKIFIEFSHKFSLEKIEDLAVNSNLILNKTWLTNDKYFMFSTFLKSITPIWERTDQIFSDYIKFENLHEQPIELRNKFIFYLGHIYTFYDIRVFSLPEQHPFYILFERGRDPLVEESNQCHRHSQFICKYPHCKEILTYNENIRAKILSQIKSNGYSNRILCSIEHELMHQETLFYMIRVSKKSTLKNSLNESPNKNIKKDIISIPKRIVERGTNETFTWDNERPKNFIEVPGFKVDNLPVTWGEMKDFLIEYFRIKDNKEIKKIANDHLNKSIENLNLDENKENIDLNKVDHNYYNIPEKKVRKKLEHPNINEYLQIRISENNWIDFENAENLPAWVNLEIAIAYIKWKNRNGIKCRLMSESEFDSLSSVIKSNKIGNNDFKHHHAMPIGYYNDFSEDGVGELFGNGWEITITPFRPFEGFQPMEIYPEYSSDFFTNHHYVLKGASPFTTADLIRKSFRNWYQDKYYYHASKFRLVYL